MGTERPGMAPDGSRGVGTQALPSVGRRRAAAAAIFVGAVAGVALTARAVPPPLGFVAGMIVLGVLEALARRWPAGRGPGARLGFLAAWAAASSLAYGGFVAPSPAAVVQSACIALATLEIGLTLVPRSRRAADPGRRPSRR